MKRLFTLPFILVMVFSGCGSDIETISVQRTGIFTFQVEGEDEIWRSTRFNFYPGQSVVREFTDETTVSVLFRRYYLVFEGSSPQGDDFELSVTLDIGDEQDMRHVYTKEYHRRKGGLHQMSMILTESSGSEKVYRMAELCPEGADDAFFEIDRQNTEEELIAGTLAASLCFEDAETGQLQLMNAQFKDIEY